MTYVFNADGTGTRTLGDNTDKITYKKQGDEVIIYFTGVFTASGSPSQLKYTITQLTIDHLTWQFDIPSPDWTGSKRFDEYPFVKKQ